MTEPILESVAVEGLPGAHPNETDPSAAPTVLKPQPVRLPFLILIRLYMCGCSDPIAVNIAYLPL
jgi:hypothetical protein